MYVDAGASSPSLLAVCGLRARLDAIFALLCFCLANIQHLDSALYLLRCPTCTSRLCLHQSNLHSVDHVTSPSLVFIRVAVHHGRPVHRAATVSVPAHPKTDIR